MARWDLVLTLTESDAADLHALYQGEWWTRGRTRADVERMLERSDVTIGLRDARDGRLVAFARALTDGVYKAFLFDVIVAEEHRGSGLGSRLLEELVHHPSLRDVHHLELYCLPDLVPFYERFGFSTDVAGVSLMRLTRLHAPARSPTPPPRPG